MNPTHLHLILTHFPIIGSFIGMAILAYGIFKKNIEIQKVALALFVFLAIVTIPVYLTGEEAEESVEHLADVSEKIIHEHEELAEKAIVLFEILGALSLFALYSLKKNIAFSKRLIQVALLLSLITFGVFAKVGSYGGQIRHSEIRDGNTSQFENHDDDDDD